jgi:hypothetical protein
MPADSARFCGSCGAANNSDDAFCTNCGKPLDSRPVVASTESEGHAPSPKPTATMDPGQAAMTEAQNSPGQPGLAAVVLSIVLAPVGLILGIVSLVKARRSGQRRPTLGFIATIVGGVGTLCMTAAIVSIVLVTNSINDSHLAAAMCQRASADPTLSTDLLALVTPLNDVSAISLQRPSAGEEQAIANKIPALSSRIKNIVTSAGEGYRDVFQSGWDVEGNLEDVASSLTPGTTTGALLPDAGDVLKRYTSNFTDDLAKQCGSK